MACVHDENPVEELPAYAPDPPLHDRVYLRCLRSREHDTDPLSLEHIIEQRGELAVPVPGSKTQAGERGS